MTEQKAEKATKVEKMCAFAKERFNIELDPSTFERTRAGYWQRSQGAWSWSMRNPNSPRCIGSQSSISEILQKKDYVVFANSEFTVENTKQNHDQRDKSR